MTIMLKMRRSGCVFRATSKAADREAFVSNLVKAQEGLYDAGYKMNLGVFESIGGGKVEANILHVRAIAPTPSDFGRVLDDFYSGSVEMGGKYWLAAFALVDKIESDYMQECAQVYTAE